MRRSCKRGGLELCYHYSFFEACCAQWDDSLDAQYGIGIVDWDCSYESKYRGNQKQ